MGIYNKFLNIIGMKNLKQIILFNLLSEKIDMVSKKALQKLRFNKIILKVDYYSYKNIW